MSTLILHSLNRFTFLFHKDFLLARPAQNFRAAQLSSPAVTAYASMDIHPVNCKCCGWKGTDSQTKNEVLFLDCATELELFCPDCNSYVGFLN